MLAVKQLTLEEIEAEIAAIGASPQDNGTVELIVRRPERLQREILESAEFDLVEGLIGDNWRTRGSSSMPDGSANPGAQVAIMNSRTIQVLAQDLDRRALAGDQLFVDLDLSVENLPPGQRLAIGTVILEISDVPHNGCGKFTERFGSGATRFVNSREGRANRRRGVNAKVVQAGTIKTGDLIKKL